MPEQTNPLLQLVGQEVLVMFAGPMYTRTGKLAAVLTDDNGTPWALALDSGTVIGFGPGVIVTRP